MNLRRRLAEDLNTNANMLRRQIEMTVDLANKAAEYSRTTGLIHEMQTYDTLSKQLNRAVNLTNRAVEICSDASAVAYTLAGHVDGQATP